MKINWKLRVKNRVTLTILCTTVVTFVYTVLGILGITPSVTQSMVSDLVLAVINILASLGVVIDPTTAGASDSMRALGYDAPREDI